MIERSCGTIPYTVKNGVIYYLLISAKGHSCGFPKGHVEGDESEPQTAIRETFEETSITPVINTEFRYEISYTLDNGNQKNVVYFLADFGDQAPCHNQGFEDFDYLILPFDRAYSELSFENTRKMLRSANDYLIGREALGVRD